MKSLLQTSLMSGLLLTIGFVVTPITQAVFSDNCYVSTFYEIDNEDLIVAEINDFDTGYPSARCQAADWNIEGDTSGLTIIKETQEVLHIKRDRKRTLLITATNQLGERTEGYKSIYAPKTAPVSGVVFIEMENLVPEEIRNVFTYRFTLEGKVREALVLNARVTNIGNRAFDPHQTDPYNPDSNLDLPNWGGWISCGAQTDPISTEFEGEVLLPGLQPQESKNTEIHLFDGVRTPGLLKERLNAGATIPCTVTPLGGYWNVQGEDASQNYDFDMVQVSLGQLRISNWRKSGEPKTVTTSTPSTPTRTGTSFTSTSGKVFLELSNLSYRYIDERSYYRPAMVIWVDVTNAGTRDFDPQERDPLNPDTDKTEYPWGGVIECGSVINPATKEFEGGISFPYVAAGTTEKAEIYLTDGYEVADKLEEGHTIPCWIQTLAGYENIQYDPAYGNYNFDLLFNGPKNLFEIRNFRKEGEVRGETLEDVTLIGSQKKHVPPAGYEDEVITAFDIFQNPFPDTDLQNLLGRAAAELYRRAIIGGFPDGEFKGLRFVNRAEAAKFLLLAKFQIIEDLLNNGQFRDVLDGEWYTKYVVKAALLKIINGHPDGTFRPADPVNTVEFLKMLALTFGLELNLPHGYLDVASGVWFEPYAGIAKKYNLFPDRGLSNLDPTRNLTRAEVAIAIYQFLSQR